MIKNSKILIWIMKIIDFEGFKTRVIILYFRVFLKIMKIKYLF